MAVNAALVAALVVTGAQRGNAHAQTEKAQTDTPPTNAQNVAMLSGLLPGGDEGVIFLLNGDNGGLAAMRWNDRNGYEIIERRNIQKDLRAAKAQRRRP